VSYPDDRPPSAVAWRLEGELVGHRPSETLRYLAACAAFADAARSGGVSPSEVVSPDMEPAGWLRRLFRRR
jgi:hypothetical protein